MHPCNGPARGPSVAGRRQVPWRRLLRDSAPSIGIIGIPRQGFSARGRRLRRLPRGDGGLRGLSPGRSGCRSVSAPRRSGRSAPADAAVRVDTEHDDRVRALVRREQERAGRVDREATRRLALRSRRGQRDEPSARRVDREDGDAVVAAIRAVQEAARRMDVDVGGGAAAGEALRQRRHNLHPPQSAALAIVAERRDGAAKLVDDVDVLRHSGERRCGAGRPRTQAASRADRWGGGDGPPDRAGTRTRDRRRDRPRARSGCLDRRRSNGRAARSGGSGGPTSPRAGSRRSPRPASRLPGPAAPRCCRSRSLPPARPCPSDRC